MALDSVRGKRGAKRGAAAVAAAPADSAAAAPLAAGAPDAKRARKARVSGGGGGAAGGVGTAGGPRVVDAATWTAAREALLVEEKALSHARAALAVKRAALPWTPVPEDYVLTDPRGKLVPLSSLFRSDEDDLLVSTRGDARMWGGHAIASSRGGCAPRRREPCLFARSHDCRRGRVACRCTT